MNQQTISLHQVARHYQLGTHRVDALKDINLTLAAGTFSFILGPSGSGKTTLLNLLGLIDRPTSGEISLQGIATSTLSDNQLTDLRNREIGTIFQSFNLIDVLSAQENVEYPLVLQKVPRRQRRERSRAILAAVGLDDRRSHRPNQLSGGQRQRVAIARALVKNPSLVLADEPTANLDSHTSHDIVELLLQIQSQYRTTFVLCTHDTEILQHAEHIVHMLDGSIVHQEHPTPPANHNHAA